MAQLIRANQALYDLTVAYSVPPVSGKDSMKNDSVRGGRKISIPPTVLFSTVGFMEDVRRAVTMGFKKPGDLIYVVGRTRNEMGGGEFYRMLAETRSQPEAIGMRVPQVDPASALALYRAMGAAHAGGWLQSSHTPTLGGVGVAFALAAMGGDLGAEIELDALPTDGDLTLDERLFSESNSRFVVTVKPEDAPAFERVFAGLPCARLGVVNDSGRLMLTLGGKTVVNTVVENLRKAFKKPLWGI
jgi:phosphoribosylformylglycinamidine synthase